MRRTGWLTVLSMLAGLLYAVVFDREPAWALDPLTPVPPPAAVAPPNVISVVTTPGPTTVSGSVTVDTVWGPQGSPYVVTSQLLVDYGVSLTLLPGTVVKLFGADGEIAVWGQLLVLGTPDRTVVFTSLRDDSVLGDTNADGAATTPAPGDWDGIRLSYSGSGSKYSGGNVVNYADFRFGGKSSSPDCHVAQLRIASPVKAAVVSNSTFSDSANSHIYLAPSAPNRFGLYSNTFSRGSGSTCGVQTVSANGDIVGNTFTDVWLEYLGLSAGARIWRNHLGGGIYLWVGSLGQPVPRNSIDVRYNTILYSANDYGRVDWTSNWWGYNVNEPLPLCMETAQASSHFPPVDVVGDPGGICAGQSGFPTNGFIMNVRPGLSGPPALSPPAPVREVAAPRFGPVDLYSGVLAYQETDFGVEDAGKRLSVTRGFRSDRLSAGDAGPGWTVSYAEGLSPDGAGGSVLTLADGGSLPFANDIAAGYTPAPGVFADYTTGAAGSSITTGEDTTYQFNPAGELTAVLLGDPGHQVGIERTAGKVSKVTGVSGRYLSFTRSSGRVTSVTDSTGRGIGLSYVDGRLSAVSGVDGESRSYQYDSSGRLVRVTSPTGVALFAVEYATDGKVAWLEEAGSGRTVFAYDPANRRTTATLANGDAIVFGYDTLGRLVSQTRGGTSTHTVYDGEGRVVSSVAGVGAVAMTGYSASASLSFFDGRNDLVTWLDPTGRRQATTHNAKHRPLVTTRNDGSTITRVYDGNNRLQALTDPMGKLWQYQFNGNGQVTRQTDPLSRVRGVTYTAAGDVQAVTDETSAVTTFGYDALGRRTSMTDPLGHQRVMTYTAWDAPATVVLPRGGTTTIAYDDDRRQISATDATNHTTLFEYDTAGRPSSQVNPDGGRITVEYDQIGRPVRRFNARGALTQYTYTPEGWPATRTEPNTAVTTFTYDPAGRQYRSTSALNQTTQVVHDVAGRPRELWNPDGGHTVLGYDVLGRRTTQTTPLGNLWRVAYDAAGRPVTWTDPLNYTTLAGYDDAGRFTSTTDQLGVVTSYSYDDVARTVTTSDTLGLVGTMRTDAAGHLIAETDGSGITTTYTYDNDGNLATMVRPAGTWTFEHDLAGRTTAQVDPLSRRTSGTYDGMGRLLTVSHPDNTGEVFDYDLAGNLIEHTDRTNAHWPATYNVSDQLATATDPLGGLTTHTYDLLGRPTAVTDATGVSTHTAYDPMGRPAVAWDALGGSWVSTYDTDGRLTGQTGPSGAGSTFSYNTRGELTQRLWGTTVSHTFTYDKTGRLTEARDPYKTTFEYDIRGRLIKQGNAYSNKTGIEYDLAGRTTKRTTPAGYATTYTYDTSGRLKDATDPLANKTQYTWDAADQLTTITLPRGGVYTHTYDLAGRLATETNPLGATTTFGYDGQDRVTSTTYPSGASTAATYDLAGRLETLSAGTQTRTFGYDATGRLTSASTAGGTLGFAYDNRGLLIRGTNGFGDTTYQHDYTGRITTVTPPSGPAATYTYDAARGLLASVRGATNLDFTYDGAGQVKSESAVLPTQASSSRSYDSAGRLEQITSTGHNAQLTYTPDSQIDTICRTSYMCLYSSKLTDYTYDNTGRLTNAAITQSGSTISTAAYTWDPDGNRASVTSNGATPVTATYDLADRLQSTSDGTTYTYDLDGKLTQRGTTTLTYTPYGELASDGSVTYGRDPLGRMATRTTAATTQTFGYDPTHGRLAAAQTGTGPITTLVRRPDNGNLLASATAGATTQRPSINAHNDIVALNDHTSSSDTTIRWQTTLDPFGVVTSTFGTTAVPLGYQGMYTDQTTGLVDMGARFYEPRTGRFTTPDTVIGDPGAPISFNRYLYGHADPVNHFDPDGHWPDWLDSALNAASEFFGSWGDEFTSGLASPGDASTSDDSSARFLGGVIEGVGELVTGTTQFAATTTRCAKDQKASCDSLGRIFTEEGMRTAWHSTVDPITGCVNTGDAATCGRATVSIAEILVGTKGAAKTASTLAHAIPNLRTAIHPLGLLSDNRMYSIGAGPSGIVRIGRDRIPLLPSNGPSVPFNGRVLLLGEGNFSFTEANIALGRAAPDNLTATGFSHDGWYGPDVLARVERLRKMGVGVQLQVDARALPAELAGGASFDTVIFQFPHPLARRAKAAGPGRELLQGFFASASQRLAPGGQIALTLRSEHYVSQWHPNDAASAAGLRLESVTGFHPGHYPGYDFVTTMAGARKPDISNSLTFLYTRG